MAVRKNVLSLSTADRARLLTGFKAMKSAGTYDPFIRTHARSTRWMSPAGTELNAAHIGPAFLPWHRKFLLEFEQKLQSAIGDSSFGLPYYDWTDAQGAASGVWKTDLMGGAGNPVSGPFAPLSWRTIDANGRQTPGLVRTLGDPTIASLPMRQDVHRLMYRRAYDAAPFGQQKTGAMRNALEGWAPFGLHNLMHVWIGGQMANVPVACNDPVFFLHHCNVDRIWAQWQLVNPTSPYVPTSGGPQGHNYNDLMYPWLTAPNTARPSDMQSISSLGFSYDNYYQIQTLQIIITTGSSMFAGTDDDVSFVIRSTNWPGPFWSVILDAAHCDHSDPFERGQTDTFTYNNVINEQSPATIPLTPAVLGTFSLGKGPDGSWFGRGDWMVAGVKIIADGLVLYDNQNLNQELNNDHQHLDDGHGNALISNP